MNIFYKQVLLISEQQVTDNNPLFDLAIVPRYLQLLPLTSGLKSLHQTHTPQGKSRSTSSIIIQVSNFGTLPYKFEIPFHITVQFSRCETPITTQNITSNFSEAHLILPEDGSQRIQNMSQLLIVF